MQPAMIRRCVQTTAAGQRQPRGYFDFQAHRRTVRRRRKTSVPRFSFPPLGKRAALSTPHASLFGAALPGKACPRASSLRKRNALIQHIQYTISGRLTSIESSALLRALRDRSGPISDFIANASHVRKRRALPRPAGMDRIAEQLMGGGKDRHEQQHARRRRRCRA